MFNKYQITEETQYNFGGKAYGSRKRALVAQEIRLQNDLVVTINEMNECVDGGDLTLGKVFDGLKVQIDEAKSLAGMLTRCRGCLSVLKYEEEQDANDEY